MMSPPEQPTRRGARAPSRRLSAADPVRLAAAKAYLGFLQGGPFVDLAPASIAGEADRRLYTQLLYTTVRFKRLLEAELSQLVPRPLARIDPVLLAVVTLGLAQLRFLERMPPHAAINETVKLAPALRRSYGRGWVNGVLRTAGRLGPPAGDALPLAVRTSHPDWMVTRWIARYGEARAAALCAANNHYLGVTLRVNARLTDAAGLRARLAAERIAALPDPEWPAALHVTSASALLASGAFADGWCYVQDISSQLLLAWAAPVLRGRVLDAAAAPGGKLLHLLSLSDTPRRAVALDADRSGLLRLRDNAQRLHLPVPPLVEGDGRALPLRAGDMPGAGFDALLLDVPCSATGTIRKHPELKWRKFEDDLPRYAAKQAELLDEATRVLAPGGWLVYSTCSLEPEENELQVSAFLRRHAGCSRVPLQRLAPPEGLMAPEDLLTPQGDLLILPNERRMGLYAALLRRDGSQVHSSIAP